MLSEILFDIGLVMCAIAVVYGGIQGLFSLIEYENKQMKIFASILCVSIILLILAELVK